MGSERRSADRVLRVMLYLAGRVQPVPAAAIASACDIPRSSLYPILAAMTRRQFLVHFPEERTWGLGIASFEIGSAYLRAEPLQRLGRPILSHLVDHLRETSHLAVLHGNQVLYLLKHVSPRRSTPLITDVGVRLPAHLTAVGRSMLMVLPDSQLRALYPSEASFVERTDRGARRLVDLRRELAKERPQGYSVESDLTTEGITCIASPVFEHRQLPIASVGISFATDRHDTGEWPTMAVAIKEAADLLTARLSGRRAV